MLRGKCFFLMRNWALAIEDFNNVIQYSPNYYRAFLWRGTAHARLGNDDLSVKDYEQAIRLHPQLAKAYFASQSNTGLPGHKDGARGPAVNDYKQAMSIVYPNGFDPNAPTRTGSADPSAEAPDADDEFAYDTDASGDHAPQMVARIKARKNNGGDGKYQALQGNPAGTDLNTTNAGNTDVGVADDTLKASKNRRVTTNMDVDPNFGRFGAVPGSQPISEDAQKILRDTTEAIRQDSTNPELYYMRAKAYQKLQDANKAYDDYSEAIRLFPEAKYYVGRASLFYQLNKPLLVEADVKAAIATDPTTPRNIHFGGDKYPDNVRWAGDGPDGH
jgi:tetratricopeptide (TPR) repeat protein